MGTQNVFECGRVCAAAMSDGEWMFWMVVMLSLPLVMIGWETRPVRWLRVQAGKVLDFWE